MNYKDIDNLEQIQTEQELINVINSQFLQNKFLRISKVGYLILKPYINKTNNSLKDIIMILKYGTIQMKQQLVQNISDTVVPLFLQLKQIQSVLNNMQQNSNIDETNIINDQPQYLNNMNIQSTNQSIEQILEYVLSKTRNYVQISQFNIYINQIKTYLQNLSNINKNQVLKDKFLIKKQLIQICVKLARKTPIRLTQTEIQFIIQKIVTQI